MKNLRKRTVLSVLAALIAIPIFSPIAVFADESTDVSTVSEISTFGSNGDKTDGNNQGPSMAEIEGRNYIPDTTIEDANQWVAKKGEDLVGFGGVLGEKIGIIGFMIGLIVTLAGALGRNNYVSKGLVIMIISVIVYVGTVFAPELVQFFGTWLSS